MSVDAVIKVRGAVGCRPVSMIADFLMRDKAFACKIHLPSCSAVTAALLINPALQTSSVYKDSLPNMESRKMLPLHQFIGRWAGNVQLCRHFIHGHGHTKDIRGRIIGRLLIFHGIL